VFKDETCFATVDPNHLATAILNLALNSRDAMPQGGKLILETGSAYLDEAYADICMTTFHPATMPADRRQRHRKRHSSGMLDKVFNPFFTSKGPGKGTGLGLEHGLWIHQAVRGHIKIYSEEGYGTTIKMYLRRAPEPRSFTKPWPFAEIEGGHETILVVEDDRLVREYVLNPLRALGYVTLDAGNAAEALAIVRAGHGFDLLFTDVIMPGTMNGRHSPTPSPSSGRPEGALHSGYTENASFITAGSTPASCCLPSPTANRISPG